MHWKVKAAVFRAFEIVPFGGKLHFLAQRHLTHSWPRPRSDVEALVAVSRKFADSYLRHGGKELADSMFLEIGAGRDLTVPLSLRMLGTGQVIAADIDRLCKLDLVNAAARHVAAVLGVEPPAFQSWADLEAYGILYRAPLDLTKPANPLPEIDAFVSTEVLEHVPASVLPSLLAAARALLRPGGLAMHNIDYSDHYARDGGVSRFNFLRFGEREWARYNSSFQFVNRLRHSQYVDLLKGAGFEIVEENAVVGQAPAEVMETLAAEFAPFELDDLQTLRSYVVARRLDGRAVPAARVKATEA